MSSFPKFYMMTPATQGSEVDVIACTTPEQCEALKGFRTTHPWVSLVWVPETDAYKYLLDDGGVGVGCYIKQDFSQANQYAMLVAKLKMLSMCKLFGHPMLLDSPVEVHPSAPIEHESRSKRAILSLKL